MKIFISNSGPIISFARAGHLDLLKKIIGELWIPEAVYEDIVVKGKGRPGSNEVRHGKWTKRKEIKDKTKLALFPPDLGRGEIEAIILSEELKAALIVDDRKARQEAERRGIETIGSLRIVKEAKEKGLIEEAKAIVDKLRESGLRIRDEVYYQFLKEMEEG